MKCKPERRQFFEKLQYFPAYLIALTLVLVVNIVSLPFAWIKVIKKTCSLRSLKFTLFALFAFPFLALVMSLVDVAMASWKLWD